MEQVLFSDKRFEYVKDSTLMNGDILGLIIDRIPNEPNNYYNFSRVCKKWESEIKKRKWVSYYQIVRIISVLTLGKNFIERNEPRINQHMNIEQLEKYIKRISRRINNSNYYNLEIYSIYFYINENMRPLFYVEYNNKEGFRKLNIANNLVGYCGLRIYFPEKIDMRDIEINTITMKKINITEEGPRISNRKTYILSPPDMRFTITYPKIIKDFVDNYCEISKEVNDKLDVRQILEEIKRRKELNTFRAMELGTELRKNYK